MLKLSTIVACTLALSGGAALAQSYTPWMAGPNAQSAAGKSRSDYSSQAQLAYGAPAIATGPTDNPRRVAITDEYGNQYNSRGQRIGHAPGMR